MAGVIIIAGLFIIGKLLSSLSANAKEKRRQEEIERIKRRQAEQRAAIKRMEADAKAWAREQRMMAVEQARQAREQERQAQQLAKHEEQIAKLEYKMGKAQFDFDFLSERVANLDAMRDNLMAQQTACTPMSKEWDKFQRKILALDNQIHSAESRMGKAQFDMAQAKAKMSA
jgi:predicted  nucleic acid-binding Zn-ribbon protein